MAQEYDVENVFTYHAPNAVQTDTYTELRNHAKILAKLILAEVPPSRERSLALTKLEESIFWANAGVARN